MDFEDFLLAGGDSFSNVMATGSPPLRLLLPTAWFVCVTPPPAHQDQQLINNLLNNIIPLNKQRHDLSDDPVATTYKIKA